MRNAWVWLCLVLLLVGCTKHKYRVELSALPPEGGKVTGAGVYSKNDVVTVSASANEGYRFENWSDGKSNRERRFRATQNVHLTAYFSAINTDTNVLKPNPDIMVTFGGKTWYGARVVGKIFEDFGYPVLQLQVVQAEGAHASAVAGLNIPTTSGTIASHGDTVYSCYYMESGSNDTLTYSGQTFPHWIALSTPDTVYASGMVTKLDLNTHTVSLALAAQMLDMATYVASGEKVLKSMSIVLNDIKFELQPAD